MKCFLRERTELYLTKLLLAKTFDPDPKVAPVLNCREVREIRLGKCPFCGNDYGSVKSLRVHLHRNLRCSIAYKLLVKSLTEKYIEFRNSIAYKKEFGTFRIKILKDGKTFHSFEEAFRHLFPEWC